MSVNADGVFLFTAAGRLECGHSLVIGAWRGSSVAGAGNGAVRRFKGEPVISAAFRLRRGGRLLDPGSRILNGSGLSFFLAAGLHLLFKLCLFGFKPGYLASHVAGEL